MNLKNWMVLFFLTTFSLTSCIRKSNDQTREMIEGHIEVNQIEFNNISKGLEELNAFKCKGCFIRHFRATDETDFVCKNDYDSCYEIGISDELLIQANDLMGELRIYEINFQNEKINYRYLAKTDVGSNVKIVYQCLGDFSSVGIEAGKSSCYQIVFD